MIVRARSISALQIGFEGQRNERLIRRFLGENELLSRRQSDDARHAQIQLGQIVARHDELLLAGLQFDLGAQGVNRRSQTGFQLVGSLVVKSLRVLDLRLGGLDSRRCGNRLQICVSDGEHDHLPRIFVAELRGLQALRGRALAFEVLEIEERLAERDTRVEIVEGRNDTRECGGSVARRSEQRKQLVEPQSRKSLSLHVLLHPRGDVGQQFAQFFPPLAPGRLGLIARQQSPRLLRRPRSMASLKSICRTSAETLPSGALPRNGFWDREAKHPRRTHPLTEPTGLGR